MPAEQVTEPVPSVTPEAVPQSGPSVREDIAIVDFAQKHNNAMPEPQHNEARAETLSATEQVIIAAQPKLHESFGEEAVTRVRPAETITAQAITKQAEPLHALAVTETYHVLEPAREMPEPHIDFELPGDSTEAIQATEYVETSTELQPELILPAVRVSPSMSEPLEVQQDMSNVSLLIEPLVIELPGSNKEAQPVTLATLDEVLAYVAGQMSTRGEAAIEQLEESVGVVEQAVAKFVQLEELSSATPETVDGVITERIDALLNSFEETPETIAELMARLDAMDDTEPELRELLIATVELLTELGVSDPSVTQVVRLARALVMQAAVEHRAAIISVIEDEWTEDTSIAHERHGLFGAHHLSGFVGGVMGHPLGQFVLRASLAAA